MPSHKSQNASDRYPTMHHFVAEMYLAQNGFGQRVNFAPLVHFSHLFFLRISTINNIFLLYITFIFNDDVIKLKYFPRYWPFERGIHRSPQRPVTRSFDVFFELRPNKRLSKQPWGWWFETLSHPLWRQSNVTGFPATWLWWTVSNMNVIQINIHTFTKSDTPL